MDETIGFGAFDNNRRYWHIGGQSGMRDGIRRYKTYITFYNFYNDEKIR